MSIMKLITRTFPFILTRILVYALFGVISFVVLGIMIGIGFLVAKFFGESGIAIILVMIASLGAIFGLLRFVERYFLYMVKMGHVAVIVELLRTGKIPEGKGMVAYGKDKVTENFGASNVAFGVNILVKGAVRQIQRWIMRIGNLFSFIPGSKNIIGIINAIMAVSLIYVDAAIMSYIFLRKSEEKDETVWKSASDGVTLYAQNWKGVLKAATGSVIFIYIFNIAIFVITLIPLLLLSGWIAKDTPGLGFLFGFLALIGASVLTTMAKRAIIDPIVTIIMVRNYQRGIRDLEPAIDLQQRLLKASSRFRRLFDRAGEEEAKAGNVQEPPVAQN